MSTQVQSKTGEIRETLGEIKDTFKIIADIFKETGQTDPSSTVSQRLSRTFHTFRRIEESEEDFIAGEALNAIYNCHLNINLKTEEGREVIKRQLLAETDMRTKSEYQQQESHALTCELIDKAASKGTLKNHTSTMPKSEQRGHKLLDRLVEKISGATEQTPDGYDCKRMATDIRPHRHPSQLLKVLEAIKEEDPDLFVRYAEKTADYVEENVGFPYLTDYLRDEADEVKAQMENKVTLDI